MLSLALVCRRDLEVLLIQNLLRVPPRPRPSDSPQ
jgi:hypothetical protein